MPRYLTIKSIFTFALLSLLAVGGVSAAPATSSRPNIVIILADDLGYGDIGCYGATRISTPNVDRIARDGLRFTDAHATSATCTPARYALMTGQYPWRKEGTGILPGDAALIIEPGRTTLPGMLQRAGYHTGIVGKWHLGLGSPGKLDWNNDIEPGPLEVGFDYSFLMPATADRVPCVLVENHRVVGLDPADPIEVNYEHPIGNDPTGKDHPELLKLHPSHGHNDTIINGISRIGFMKGGNAARWVDQNLADTFTQKAENFIDQNHERPFFLYFATHDPHVPRAPNPRFIGQSGCGIRGDAIVEFDWCVGQILDTLERLHLTTNTLVILSSDNGPVLDDGYQDNAVADLHGHRPAGPLRGGKYSGFEGGTRIPLILRWPARIKPGVSDALVCHVDFLASFAALTGQALASGDAPDSRNVLAAFLGESKVGRQELVEQGGPFGMRDGLWKYIEPTQGPKINRPTNTELGNSPVPQLYNLSDDIGESTNIDQAHPEHAKQLADELGAARKAGGYVAGHKNLLNQ